MCGIAGFIRNRDDTWRSPEVENEKIIRKMCSRMIQRGPDDSGVWFCPNNNLALGHRRLSILDLSENGRQPMVSASGRFVICYNGEIYNYGEILKELKESGFSLTLKSHCDTEVLLEAAEFWGIDRTLSKIRGMFAIAVYDREKAILYLARDRMGEKPLAYGYIGGDFVFASTTDAIRAYTGGSDLKLSRAGILEFLYYGYISAPLSIYQGIFKVLPGEILTVNAHNGEILDSHKYWNIEHIAGEHKVRCEKNKITEDEASHRLEELLSSAVQEQMVADVPVGAYLSGGVDSSLVVAIMRNLAGNQIRTYTIGIEGEKSDESQWALKVAQYLGVHHETEYISKLNMIASLKEMASVFDEPFADVSQVPTYMVSKLARKDVTVTLSGDGGDELFCGYEHYWDYSRIWDNICNSKKYSYPSYLAAKIISKCPLGRYSERAYQFANKCRAHSSEELYRVIPAGSWAEKAVRGFSPEQLRENATPLWSYHNSWLGELENLMLVDQLQYLPDDILVKVDRTGMAVSLENRIPLLDKRIVEFAWSLPIEYKYRNGVSKKLMRNVLYKYVPRELIDRPKQGFAFPALRWITETEELRQWTDELFNSTSFRDAVIINKNIPLKMWKSHLAGKEAGHILWNYIMLLAWAKERDIVL